MTTSNDRYISEKKIPQAVGSHPDSAASEGLSKVGTAAESVRTTSTSTSSSTSGSNLGPGPRRFRGDVPAFNPSNLSPHMYNQPVHQYAPQPPIQQPVYPTSHPQYFTQQPQFIPYAGQMMPYYPMAMNYPDYSMYQPYQYYAMPAGQFQSPSAYMSMNGMANGIQANGYVPNRKKHFNKPNQHYNYNGSSQYQNNNYTNGHAVTHDNSSTSSFTKHASSSSHSLNGSTEIEETADSLPVTKTIPESASRSDTDETKSKDVTTGVAAHEAGDSPLDEINKLNEVSSQSERIASAPLETHERSEDVSPSLQSDSVAEIYSSEDIESKPEPPFLFDLTLREYVDGRQLFFEIRGKVLEKKSNVVKEIIDSDVNKNYYVDSKREFKVIDHNVGTQAVKRLSGLKSCSDCKEKDDKVVETTIPKPALNWASLLQTSVKKPKKTTGQIQTDGETPLKPFAPSATSMPISSDRAQSLGLLIMSVLFDPTFKLNSCEPFQLNPRGLTNTGNICYMNAVLQCLIFCAPFNKILRLVEEKSIGLLGKASSTPVLDATIEFMNDFSKVNANRKSSGSSINADGIVVGCPLSPETLFSKLIKNPKFRHLKWGDQEDAEEFLVYFLDGLHEDFVKAEATVTPEQMDQLCSLYGQKLDLARAEDLKAKMKRASRLVKSPGSNIEEQEEADVRSEQGWSEVAGRRKASSKRVSEVEPSPITSLFGGRFRSVLTIPKSKEAHSITIDPFRCMQLDISSDDVETIEDALWKLNEVEKLPYKNEEGLEVTASKQTYIEDLPEILTLQLKRFSFQQKGTPLSDTDLNADARLSDFHSAGKIEKILKNITYGLDLAVPLESLSPAARNVQNRKYSLTGVIYHHGRNAEGGHYTCDVLREGSKWLRIDDTAVESIGAMSVTEKPIAKDKSAYILIYQRIQNV